MTIETMDKAAVGQSTFDVQGRLGELHGAFGIGENQYERIDNHVITDDIIRQEFDISDWEMTDEVRQTAYDTIKAIFDGTEADGRVSLGLNEICSWKKNEMCIEQQAGNAAEVIGTAKENFSARIRGSGKVTYRTEDMPAEIRRQSGDIAESADKIRVKDDGSVERVKTAFVGSDSESCARKLLSKAYDKVIESGKVEKVEVPKEYYDELKRILPEERDALLQQYDRVCAEGNTDAAEKLLKRIDNLEKLSDMIEPSIIKKAEAVYSVIQMIEDPEFQQCIEDTYSELLESASENYQLYQQGKMSFGGAVLDTVADVTQEAADGIAEIKEGTALSEAADAASDIIDDCHKYFEGEMSGRELLYNIGGNAAEAVGAFAGEMISETPQGKILGSLEGIETKEEWVQMGKEIAVETYESAVETAQNIGEAVNEAVGDVKEAVSDAADAVTEKMEDIGKSASELADSIGDSFSDAADKASEIKDAAKEKLANLPFDW